LLFNSLVIAIGQCLDYTIAIYIYIYTVGLLRGVCRVAGEFLAWAWACCFCVLGYSGLFCGFAVWWCKLMVVEVAKLG